MKSIIKYSILITLVMICWRGTTLFAQNPVDSATVKYVTLSQSKIWIDGSSTINDFTCETNSVYGIGYIKDTKIKNDSIKKDNASLKVKVRTLDCGKDGMNEDMFDAMKAETYPQISYKLISFTFMKPMTNTSSQFKVKAEGRLTIAGKTNVVPIIFTVTKLPNGVYRIKGDKELSMHDYNIDPPSAFFGLIKAHDKLVVNFDLYVTANSYTNDVATLSKKD